MRRTVQPEILDSLAPDDPAALANRRDLRLFNYLMGNFRWVERVLARNPLSGRILELGAGDASLGRYLLRKGILSESCRYTAVERIARPDSWPHGWEWIQEDLRRITIPPDTRLLIANMILHQFEENDLRELGRRIADSGIKRLLLCEPTRRRLHQYQVAASRLLGVHRITLHDARVSIDGGFRNDEIVRELGLDRTAWSITWSEHFFGANRVICERQ